MILKINDSKKFSKYNQMLPLIRIFQPQPRPTQKREQGLLDDL